MPCLIFYVPQVLDESKFMFPKHSDSPVALSASFNLAVCPPIQPPADLCFCLSACCRYMWVRRREQQRQTHEVGRFIAVVKWNILRVFHMANYIFLLLCVCQRSRQWEMSNIWVDTKVKVSTEQREIRGSKYKNTYILTAGCTGQQSQRCTKHRYINNNTGTKIHR